MDTLKEKINSEVNILHEKVKSELCNILERFRNELLSSNHSLAGQTDTPTTETSQSPLSTDPLGPATSVDLNIPSSNIGGLDEEYVQVNQAQADDEILAGFDVFNVESATANSPSSDPLNFFRQGKIWFPVMKMYRTRFSSDETGAHQHYKLPRTPKITILSNMQILRVLIGP